ncbi:IclR family transcriptional regulator [Yinghuangia sp. YIM S09857]|uniref:IclR family transcriptional regulator n=1 Tax=Yinghuangia sp. YIM S09857 TaxID=3436929 RepID=UPI003F538724
MKSVRTAIRVFESVAARQPIGLSELSRHLGVPKASVQRALDTLYQAGWLRRDASDPGRWFVSARFAVLADTAPVIVAAREAARPHLWALREETGLPTGLFVLDGSHMAYVAGAGDATDVRAIELTHGPLPVHVSAAGRAILSRLPARTRREVLDRSLRRYTDASLTDPESVLDAVARVERDGYAIVVGEFREDTTTVSAPILDRYGMPVAAVTLFAVEDRVARVVAADAGAQVLACARAISDELAVSAVACLADAGSTLQKVGSAPADHGSERVELHGVARLP